MVGLPTSARQYWVASETASVRSGSTAPFRAPSLADIVVTADDGLQHRPADQGQEQAPKSQQQQQEQQQQKQDRVEPAGVNPAASSVPAQLPSSAAAIAPRLGRAAKHINRFVLGAEIARSSMAKIRLCFDSLDGREYAVKTLSRSRLGRARRGSGVVPTALNLSEFRRECAMLRKLHHRAVVRVLDVIDDPLNDRVHIVMERVELGPVMPQRMSCTPLALDNVWAYFRDLVTGLSYLHRSHVLHRDIKPSNLLLGTDGHVRIADLGSCRLMESDDDDRLTDTAGTPAFTAPEICTADRYSGRAADVWALGATLFMMLFGRPPFVADTVHDLYNAIQTQPIVFPPEFNQLPLALQHLLQRILDKDPATRITLPEILVHPWVTNDGQAPLPGPDEPDQRAAAAPTATEIEHALSTFEDDGPIEPVAAAAAAAQSQLAQP